MQAHARRSLVGLGVLVLVLMGRAGTAPAQLTNDADDPKWLKDLKNPFDGFNWGADLRLRHEYLKNTFLNDGDPPGHDWSFNRYRARIWAGYSPVKQLDLNARLTWEGRYWFQPESREGFEESEIIWDNLNARFTLGDPKNTSLTVTVGRQDIILGDGWLVLEGTPLDGSRSIYFDAARFTLSVNKTTFDLIYIEQRANEEAWLRPFESDNRFSAEQNERAIIFYASGKLSPASQLDGYFIWKHDDAVAANGDDGDVYTVGARVVHDFSKNLRGRAEGAYQFGNRHNAALFPNSDGDLSAFGTLSRLTYFLKDDWKQEFFVEYEFLSGDDPGTRRNEQFDVLWGRWPQYSELYVYPAAVDNRIAEQSNVSRIAGGWQAWPTQKLNLYFAYHAIFAPENPRAGRPGFSNDGYFRGHLFTGIIRYQFNRFMSGHLWGEYFIPGSYYDDAAPGPLSSRQDPVMFLRAELMFAL